MELSLKLCSFFLYSIEQIFLISLTILCKSNSSFNLVISIYVVVVLTTFSLQKLVMQSKIRVLEDKINLIQSDSVSKKIKFKLMLDKYNELLEKSEMMVYKNHRTDKK
jgi:hypothetical protein